MAFHHPDCDCLRCATVRDLGGAKALGLGDSWTTGDFVVAVRAIVDRMVSQQLGAERERLNRATAEAAKQLRAAPLCAQCRTPVIVSHYVRDYVSGAVSLPAAESGALTVSAP